MARLNPRLSSKNQRVSLNWTQLNAVITGISAIDLGSLAIRNRREAHTFCKEYGFNLDNPAEREHIRNIHQEAVQFIESFFLTPQQRVKIPKLIRNPDNILDLLVYSSNYLNKSNLKQLWACAVLKVMHGLFHIDHDYKLKYFDEIRKQIFDSLDKIVVSEGDQHVLQNGHMRIPLFFYEKKRNKNRPSILLKLLAKPSYVASDIYDHLGIRLIFETKSECLFALKLMRRSHLITVTNIKPFRSRNNLLDLQVSKKVFQRYRESLARAKSYPLDIFKKMDKELAALTQRKGEKINPHSSDDYQAIQITVRKMIRVPNPVYEKLKMLRALIADKRAIPPHLAEREADRELAFHFDYEIQLMDRESYLTAMAGPASHQAYKQRQLETARKRVLGPQLIKHLSKVQSDVA